MSRRARANAQRVLVQKLVGSAQRPVNVAVSVPQYREDDREARWFVLVPHGQAPSIEFNAARSVRFSRARRQARLEVRKLYLVGGTEESPSFVRVF